jgi:hypothetical protein
MKTKLFRKIKFPLLWRGLGGGLLLLMPTLLFANGGISITNFNAGAGTVTFNVAWTAGAVSDNKAWVFVDYNTGSKMERLPVTGATVTEGSTQIVDDNDKGAWVIANNSENFSAMVTLSYNADEVGTVSGACVYASGYPPVADYETPQTINFTGTPPYDLVLKRSDASTVTQQVSSPYYMPSGFTLVSFSDKTGAPGITNCIPMEGTLDFPTPDVPKLTQITLAASWTPTPGVAAPPINAITYTWSAPAAFNPATGTGTNPSFQTRAPADPADYPVTLTANATGYCDKQVTKDVTVMNCGGGLLETNKSDLYPNCTTTNDGGKISAQ